MSTRNLYFLITVAIFLAVHIGMASYFFVRSRRLSRASWEDLMTKLVLTNRQAISIVALEMVDESGELKDSDEETSLEPSELWSLIGGMEGLQAMESNSEVLIALAFHLQQWYPEALAVSEGLRLDARELHWHVSRLKGAAKNGNLQISFPFYARRAVCTYYLMTQRLLRLYEAGDFTMLLELRQAL